MIINQYSSVKTYKTPNFSVLILPTDFAIHWQFLPVTVNTAVLE